MPSYGTNGGMPIRPVTIQREGCRYAQLRRTRTAVYMSIYGKHGRQPICSAMVAAIDKPSYNGGRGTDMPSYGSDAGPPICPVRKETSCISICT